MANTIRGADLLVKSLAEAGVNTIFALSGNQIMSIFDACLDFDINIVHTRHEGAAVYMAEAYAQLTGSPGVALVTAGAGVGNAAGALFSASESDTPLLLMSGDSPVALDGKGAFQELHQTAITSALTRWSHRVESVNTLGRDFYQALQLACTPHPGPVHLALPADVLNHQAPVDSQPLSIVRDAAATESIEKTAQALAAALQPVVVTGPSINRTRQLEFCQALEQKYNVPVVNMESPRGLNDPSLGSVKSKLARADLIVSLGKRIDFSVGYGQNNMAEWHVVVGSQAMAAQAQSNLTDHLQHLIVADPIMAAEQLINTDVSGINPRAHWIEQVSQAVNQRLPAHATSVDDYLLPDALCAEVQQAIDQCGNAVLICDGGEFGQWAQACLSAPRRVINGLSGSIGGGIGYGIGAAKALPGATVFVMTGDGSVGFHLAELETAVRNNLSMVVIVGNDARWNAEHQLQIREFGAERLHSCALSQISYHNTCVALGGEGARVSSESQLRDVLSARCDGGVVCIDVALDGLPAPTI